MPNFTELCIWQMLHKSLPLLPLLASTSQEVFPQIQVMLKGVSFRLNNNYVRLSYTHLETLLIPKGMAKRFIL